MLLNYYLILYAATMSLFLINLPYHPSEQQTGRGGEITRLYIKRQDITKVD